MSVCIRTISNKLSLPFIGTGKSVSPVDRQLTKNVKKTTAFLEEFFGAGLAVQSKTREPVANGHFLVKPLETTSDNVIAWNYKLQRERNWYIRNNENKRIEDITRRPLIEISQHNTSRTIFSVADNEKVVRSEEESDLQPMDGKPSEEQLNHVYQVLHKDLPHFFIRSVDYTIYHNDIQFENNIKGTVTKGIYEYAKQVAMLRIIGHLKFAYVRFEVLKMTINPEDDSVKVRWRIRGVTGGRIFLSFWKFKLWNLQASIDQLDAWHDGFSTFYVDNSGKVIKHVADKMMPDQDNELTTKDKSGIAAKLALFLGVASPREFLTDILPILSFSIKPERSDAACRKTVDSSLEQIK